MARQLRAGRQRAGDGESRTLVTGRGAIGAVTASLDGTTVAAAANDSLITLWQVADGAQVIRWNLDPD